MIEQFIIVLMWGLMKMYLKLFIYVFGRLRYLILLNMDVVINLAR